MRRLWYRRLRGGAAAQASVLEFWEVCIAAHSLRAAEFTGVILRIAYKKIFCPVSWKEINEVRRLKTFCFSYLTF